MLRPASGNLDLDPPRLRVLGLGSKENIVGTGTDDVVDAADRRVDFRLVGCEAG